MNTPDRNSKPANSRTVLVLDDDVLVRMPVVQFLRDCGYRVVEAATIDEAIALLEKTNIPLDVVLSKIDIPGSMNGFGFAQWARSVRPELKILLAATPERTVQNAAELCEVGPTRKRPYDHKLRAGADQASSRRSGAAGPEMMPPHASFRQHRTCKTAGNSLDHIVGNQQKVATNRQSQFSRSPQIDDYLECGGLLYG
jgi:CheY-like chemotaxis protein